MSWELDKIMTNKSKKKIAITSETAKSAPMVAPAKNLNTAPTAAATHKAPRTSVALTPTAVPVAEHKPTFDARAQYAEIEREAYLLWETGGRKHGQADSDWLRAVEVVRARFA